MDPFTIAVMAAKFMFSNPELAMSAANKATQSSVVNTEKMQSSLVDLSKGVLACYHKSARFHLVDVVQSPWPRQAQYAAKNSVLLRIRYFGITKASYEMTVAVMGKEDKVRTAVVSDTAVIPWNKKCQLEEWTGAQKVEDTESKSQPKS